MVVRGINKAVDLVPVPDVATVGECSSTEAPNLRSGLLARVLLSARDDDVGAGLGKRPQDRAAEPARSTGDERNPPCQIEELGRRARGLNLIAEHGRLPPSNENNGGRLVDVLPHSAAVDENVQVTDDLPGHEHGLCLRDLVRPELARDLERRVRTAGDELRDPVEPVRRGTPAAP